MRERKRREGLTNGTFALKGSRLSGKNGGRKRGGKEMRIKHRRTRGDRNRLHGFTSFIEIKRLQCGD